MESPEYIRFFREIGLDDINLVGGKNASLGELYQGLTPMGIRVPNGFAVTADAYRDMVGQADGWGRLHDILDGLDIDDMEKLAAAGAQAREVIYRMPLPARLGEQIAAAYHALEDEYGPEPNLAVRSSATAEDLPDASFAGQHDSFLNVRGIESLIDSCKHCFASLFTARAIHYRLDKGFDHFKIALSVGVMKMVRSDLAASGVIFTIDTESGFRDVVFITGGYGLGENIVQGAIDPDEFYVFKPTLESGHRAILKRRLGSKRLRMVYGEGDEATRNVPTAEDERHRYCISDDEALTLADYAIKVERHYSARAGHPEPMDIEWAKDGVDGYLYLVQARPETVASQKKGAVLTRYRLTGSGPVVARGRAVGTRIASGPARIVSGPEQLREFRPGEVLVADITTPDWEPVMKEAAAIVTNHGGRTCHAAIVARELGVPAVVGTNDATTSITDGATVTVSCAGGEDGIVYDGAVAFEASTADVDNLQRPATDIMIILGNPDIAFQTSFLPNDGVGLARMEFIVAEHIKAHPMALIHPEKVADAATRQALENLTRGYAKGADFFVERLSEGVATIAAAFYPKPVIVRMSDFKSNEYAALLGGRFFEPKEANPMLGFRGAARYTHPDYEEGFALECLAMRRVRGEMGLDNVKLMIPFCRRVAEARAVIGKMAGLGLERGRDGLEIFVMCEIPNNVIQIDAFARYFDGFSIGSNDLTQLTLGVDRDSELVAFDYDERDPGVKEMILLAVEGCRRNGRHSGICGQAPSDFPEMAEYLTRLGIDSISVNPDSVIATTLHVLEIEQHLDRSRPASRTA